MKTWTIADNFDTRTIDLVNGTTIQISVDGKVVSILNHFKDETEARAFLRSWFKLYA